MTDLLTVAEYVALRAAPCDWATQSDIYHRAARLETARGVTPRYRRVQRWDGRWVNGTRVFEIELLDEASGR